MQTFIYCTVTLLVSGVTAPIIKSTKNCICYLWYRSWYWYSYFLPPWPEVTVPLPWHTPEVADTFFSTPDDGCVTLETCRVTWQWINVCILLHRVGPLLTLNHDARNDVFKILKDPSFTQTHVILFHHLYYHYCQPLQATDKDYKSTSSTETLKMIIDVNTIVCHRQICMIFLEMASIYWNWFITG